MKAFNFILVAKLALAGCLAVIVALSDPPSVDGPWLRASARLAVTPSLRKWVEASPCFGKCK